MPLAMSPHQQPPDRRQGCGGTGAATLSGRICTIRGEETVERDVTVGPHLGPSAEAPDSHVGVAADPRRSANSWCEIDVDALAHNVGIIRRSLAPGARLGAVVKGNAYGHGLLAAAGAFVRGGADWLCVFDVDEALALRDGGRAEPILILGRVHRERLGEAAAIGARLMVFDLAGIDEAARAGRAAGVSIPLHLEVETGNWRQGMPLDDVPSALERLADDDGVYLEGVATHFSDVEDTTDHAYARGQLDQLRELQARLACTPQPDGEPLMVHCGNSAATILWPHAHLSLVRTGIAGYGMWPSKETYISALEQRRPLLDLRPALTWKARVVHVAMAPAGAYIGYGRTYRTTHPSRIATLAVGYADGYGRELSNRAHVLVHGMRAPVRGRVCMNLLMVDVTHVPQVRVDDVAVLMGSGDSDAADRITAERITAEQLAEWSGTINYEITTRISPRLPRLTAEQRN